MLANEPPEHRICRQKTDAEKKWFEDTAQLRTTLDCSTCDGNGTVKCLAHLAGDGCEDLVLTCPDCRQPPATTPDGTGTAEDNQHELVERFRNQAHTRAAAIEELADMLPEAQSTV